MWTSFTLFKPQHAEIETQLMRDPVTVMLLADQKICPSLRDVNNIYEKWLVEKKGLSNGPEMFDHLEETVEAYNTTNAHMRGIVRMVVMRST